MTASRKRKRVKAWLILNDDGQPQHKSDNVQDCLRKGRASGQLNPELVETIRGQCAAGQSKASVARAFGVSHTTVSRIINGRKARR